MPETVPLSRCKLVVAEPLAHGASRHYPHLLSGVKRANVVPTAEFVHVPPQVLHRHVVICPVEPTFHQRPKLSIPLVLACRFTYSPALCLMAQWER